VPQFGHVLARSQLPRGDSASTVRCTIVLGGDSTFAGASRVTATNEKGGSEPRGNLSMIVTDTTRV
jgi:hypothetical protein